MGSSEAIFLQPELGRGSPRHSHKDPPHAVVQQDRGALTSQQKKTVQARGQCYHPRSPVHRAISQPVRGTKDAHSLKTQKQNVFLFYNHFRVAEKPHKYYKESACNLGPHSPNVTKGAVSFISLSIFS